MEKMLKLQAVCPGGAEKALVQELRTMGKADKTVQVDGTSFGQVRFRCGLAGVYRALMSLRTADRISLEAASFEARDFDALFNGVAAVRWQELVPRGAGLKVAKVRCHASVLAAETSVQAIVHKAAAQSLCRAYNVERLPDFGFCAELRVSIDKNRASILLDLAGDPLFKRGYRTQGGTAPLRETTAAAMLLLSGWKRKFPLCDPFCGSGTIALEAWLFAMDIAPGLSRDFAISRLGLANKKVEAAVRRELTERIDWTRRVEIFGSDMDASAVQMAVLNYRNLTQNHEGTKIFGPKFKVCAMKDTVAPSLVGGDGGTSTNPAGFIITNPPYGKRIGDQAEAEANYREMAVLRERFPGWKMVVISDSAGFESHFGTKAASCRELSNGALKTYLYIFE